MKTTLSLLFAVPLALTAQDKAPTPPEKPSDREWDINQRFEQMQREAREGANLERRLQEMIEREVGPLERPLDPRPAAPPWLIGLAVEPLDPFIRSHLDIPGDTGVRVSMVAPEGPAAKAGLQQNDILLSANGRKLRSLPELKEIVMQAGREGKPIDMELLHEGQRKTVSIEVRGPDRPQEKGPESGEGPADAKRPMMEIQRRLDAQQLEIEKLRREVEQLREKINRE